MSQLDNQRPSVSTQQGADTTGSDSSGGTFSGDAAQPSQKAGKFAGGIIVHDGAAYVVHKLQNEMSLPDGSKVKPDGTILESDGSTRSIGSGQALSLDGRVVGAPFSSDPKAVPTETQNNPPTLNIPSEEIGGSSSTVDPLDLGNNADSNPAGQDNTPGESSGAVSPEQTPY